MIHSLPLAAQRGRPRLQQLSTKQTTTATVICPRFCPASKRETQGRKRTENELGSSNHTSTAKSLQTLPQNLPPIPPSARSRSTATTVQPRDSTVSPLLNKRVRGVVDEANGLMHLRPREGTYSAQEYNAAQSIGMNCGLPSIKVRIGRKKWRGSRQSTSY